ncbi:MAG: hypothetical protein AB7E52_04025 [Bdellovibrionales bacterium]
MAAYMDEWVDGPKGNLLAFEQMAQTKPALFTPQKASTWHVQFVCTKAYVSETEIARNFLINRGFNPKQIASNPIHRNLVFDVRAAKIVPSEAAKGLKRRNLAAKENREVRAHRQDPENRIGLTWNFFDHCAYLAEYCPNEPFFEPETAPAPVLSVAVPHHVGL